MSRTSGRGGRNAVLGVAMDMTWDDLRPFVDSLRRTSFDGDLVLFVAGLDDDTSRRLREAGALLQPVRRLRYQRSDRVFHPHDPPLRRFRSSRVTVAYPWAIRALSAPVPRRLQARSRLAAPLSVPHVGRFFHYHAFLHRTTVDYENAMLTDVRDVFFRQDPFAFEIGPLVHCFLEHEGATLGSQKHNREWIRSAYGDEVLRELADAPISCSGVTIGSKRAVLGYLDVMVDLLLRIPRQHGGIDQAAHNYAIRRGLLEDVVLVPNNGPVATLALVPEDDVLAALPDGYAQVNVFHQYDRHPPLAELLLSRLR